MTPYLKLEIHLPETDHFWYKVGPKTSSKWLQVYIYIYIYIYRAGLYSRLHIYFRPFTGVPITPCITIVRPVSIHENTTPLGRNFLGATVRRGCRACSSGFYSSRLRDNTGITHVPWHRWTEGFPPHKNDGIRVFFCAGSKVLKPRLTHLEG